MTPQIRTYYITWDFIANKKVYNVCSISFVMMKLLIVGGTDLL